MFTSFARRLTGWYVVGAVTLVASVLGAFAVVGLVLYVHTIQDGIDAAARDAQAFSVRAAIRHQSFIDSALEVEQRLARPGIRMIAAQRGDGPPRQLVIPNATSIPLLVRGPTPARPRAEPSRVPQAQSPAQPADQPTQPPASVIDGRVEHIDPHELRLSGSRIGFALGTALGAHFDRVDLADGDLRIYPDPDATEHLTFWLFGGVVALSALAGLLAWFGGRYITGQVLRPLVEVTHALQRFATRDFTPQPIAVAGKSEFDAIAVAYNAAAAQVAAAFAERQQAEGQMRQFVADAGHELRTPLTIVLGYIDLLRRKADGGDERSRRIFTSISIEGARMRTLIDNLVLLARMEGDDVRALEPFELCPLLEQIVDARKLLHPRLAIGLACEVDATVIGDQTEIQEAIANVVDNAIKYAPGSPIRILARGAAGGVEVAIADEGPGIHPDDRTAIFDRFYRGATRGEVEGSGLGLAIAKRAVERASGTLTLADTSPTGTTFVLKLRADRVRPRAVSPSRA